MMDGAYYRNRAAEVRAEADRATIPDIISQLLTIAEQYDALARLGESQSRSVNCDFTKGA